MEKGQLRLSNILVRICLQRFTNLYEECHGHLKIYVNSDEQIYCKNLSSIMTDLYVLLVIT